MIEITVKTLDSQNHNFTVEDDITVDEFKVKIADSVNIPADTQRIIYCGRVLQDNVKLNDYDVNGKVVHLVQRPPPSSGSPPNEPAPPRPQRQNFAGFDNAVYLGSMAFPAEMLDPQYMSHRPTPTLATSRIIVARRILRRAAAVLDLLEQNRNISQQSTPVEEEVSSAAADVAPDATVDDGIESSVNVFENEAVIDVETPTESSDASVSVGTPLDDCAMDSTNLQDVENGAANNLNENVDNLLNEIAPDLNDMPSTSAGIQPIVEDVDDQINTDTNGSNTSANGRQTRRSNQLPARYTPTRSMSDLLVMLQQLQIRFQPFLNQFQDFMSNDPQIRLENVRGMQLMLNRVSEVMHNFGHVYHLLSDFSVRVSQLQPPRPLLCRPVIIQHSAVVEAGIPIQLEAQINLERPNMSDQTTANTGTTTTTTNPSTASATTSSTATTATTTASVTSDTAASADANGTATSATAQSPTVTGSGRSRRYQTLMDRRFHMAQMIRNAQREASAMASPSTETANRSGSHMPDDLEFFMEVSPDMAGLASGSNPELLRSVMNFTGQLLNRVVTSQTPAQGGLSTATTTGAPTSAGAADAADTSVAANLQLPAPGQGSDTHYVLPNFTIIRTMLNGEEIPTVRQPSVIPVDAPLEDATTQTSSVGTSQSATPAAQATSSQARGNTQTNPTTATYTRSTTRPHIHLSPQYIQNRFDPYLSCNSHHIFPMRLNNRIYRRQAGSGSRSNRSATGEGSSRPNNSYTRSDFGANHRMSHGNNSMSNSNANLLNLFSGIINSLRSTLEHQTSNISNEASNETAQSTSLESPTNAVTEAAEADIPINPTSVATASNTLTSILTMFFEAIRSTTNITARSPRTQIGGHNFDVIAHLVENFSALQNSSVADIIQHLLASENSDAPGESTLIDFIMLASRNISLLDLIVMNGGNMHPLERLRDSAQEFIEIVVLRNDLGETGIQNAVRRIYEEFRPFFERFNNLPTRNNIDIVRSFEKLVKHQLTEILRIGINICDLTTTQRLLNKCVQTVKLLAAIAVHSSIDGTVTIERIFHVFFLSHVGRISADLREWIFQMCWGNFSNFLNHIDIPLEEYAQFIVYKNSDDGAGTSRERDMTRSAPRSVNADVSSSQRAIETEPMEEDKSSELEASPALDELINFSNEHDGEPPVPVIESPPTGLPPLEDTEQLPNVIIGSESWHHEVPEDWVPIITRDVQRQRRQSPRGPFSDAYISGLPSKRRKLINSRKPPGGLSDIISESVRRAVTSTGLVQAACLDDVSNAVGTSEDVQVAFRSMLRERVHDNFANNEDFDAQRFPNAAAYFDRTDEL